MNNDQIYNLDNSIGYIINRTALHLKLVLLHSFKKAGYDVTPEQWAILLRLSEEDGQYQRQIADKLLKDKPNITRILDLLEKRNLVSRKSDENDRRKFKIYLTQEGRELIKKLIPIAQEIQNKYYQNLSEEEAQTLIRLLNKIYEI